MIIYIDNSDKKRIEYTTKQGAKQYLYVHDAKGFEIRDLGVKRREFMQLACDLCRQEIAFQCFKDQEITSKQIDKAINKVKGEIYDRIF